MKTLKILILAGFITLFSVEGYSQISFGAVAGMNMSNVIMQNDDPNDDLPTTFLPGVSLGLNVNYMLRSDFYIRSGLVFNMKGYSVDYDKLSDNSEGYDRYSPYFLTVPFDFVYSLNHSFSVYAGLFLGFGIGGKETWNYTYSLEIFGSTVSTTSSGSNVLVPIYSENSQRSIGANELAYNGADFGVSFGANYQINDMVFVGLGYSQSLVNFVAPGEAGRDQSKAFLYTLNLSAGVNF